MMTDMTPDEARQFYEEDEDPAEIRARFELARRQGRLRLTAEPKPRPEPMPVGEMLAGLVTEIASDVRRMLREVRLRDRAQKWRHNIRRIP